MKVELERDDRKHKTRKTWKSSVLDVAKDKKAYQFNR
jgi:hypothetical protein